MSNDESRRQFEEWVRRNFLGNHFQLKLVCGNYSNSLENNMYRAWQASRQSIEITPPDPVTTREALDEGYYGDYAAGRNDGIEDTLKIIREAGIKIKGE